MEKGVMAVLAARKRTRAFDPLTLQVHQWQMHNSFKRFTSLGDYGHGHHNRRVLCVLYCIQNFSELHNFKMQVSTKRSLQIPV